MSRHAGRWGRVRRHGARRSRSGDARGGQISLGAAWGKRRAPSLLDVGQAKILTWDGRHDAAYNQPFAPIEASFEMNSSRLYVAEQVAARYAADYTALFGALPDFSDTTRFPPLTAAQTGCPAETLSDETGCHGMPGDGAEYDGMAPADQEAVTRVVVNFGKALGAYERKLSCGQSRVDAWVNGDATALSVAEQNGAVLFAGKAGCTHCHSGPFMSDQQFHNLGLTPAVVAVAFIDNDDHGAKVGLADTLADPLNVRGTFSDGDDGRLPTTVSAAMDGAFRTPSLRCVSQRPSLFHTGQIGTLAQAVSYFVAPHEALIGTSELVAVDLSESEQADLVAFLAALDGPGAAANLRTAP
jgi:cytochrome c peroxidase